MSTPTVSRRALLTSRLCDVMNLPSRPHLANVRCHVLESVIDNWPQSLNKWVTKVWFRPHTRRFTVELADVLPTVQRHQLTVTLSFYTRGDAPLMGIEIDHYDRECSLPLSKWSRRLNQLSEFIIDAKDKFGIERKGLAEEHMVSCTEIEESHLMLEALCASILEPSSVVASSFFNSRIFDRNLLKVLNWINNPYSDDYN